MHLKLLQKELFKKTAEATDDLIGNRIADKITKVSKHLTWNSSETVESETENIGFSRETHRNSLDSLIC